MRLLRLAGHTDGSHLNPPNVHFVAWGWWHCSVAYTVTPWSVGSIVKPGPPTNLFMREDTMNPPTAQSGRRLIALRLATVTAAAVMGLWAPADAWADEEARSVSGFQAVALEGPFTVKVSLAEKELVRVSTPGHSDGAAALVETTVENRKGIPTLVIRGARSWSWRKTQASITVAGPQFKALAVSGSGVLEASLSNQPSLLVQMAGSGDLRVHSVTTHQIEVNVAGSGDVRIKGAAQNLSVSVAGSGDAWLQELEAEDVRVSVAGSGDARVNARQRLRVSVAGSGDVRWTGPATEVTSKMVGSGSLKRL